MRLLQPVVGLLDLLGRRCKVVLLALQILLLEAWWAELTTDGHSAHEVVLSLPVIVVLDLVCLGEELIAQQCDLSIILAVGVVLVVGGFDQVETPHLNLVATPFQKLGLHFSEPLHETPGLLANQLLHFRQAADLAKEVANTLLDRGLRLFLGLQQLLLELVPSHSGGFRSAIVASPPYPNEDLRSLLSVPTQVAVRAFLLHHTVDGYVAELLFWQVVIVHVDVNHNIHHVVVVCNSCLSSATEVVQLPAVVSA